VRQAMGPLAEVDAAAFGAEVDYTNDETRNLALGVETSIGLLRAAPTPRKALIVISDGADEDMPGAMQRLARVREASARDGIELYGIYWNAEYGASFKAMSVLMRAEKASTTHDVPLLVRGIAERINNRVEVGFDTKEFDRDGCEHRYELRLRGVAFPASSARLTLGQSGATCRPRGAGESRSWVVPGVVIGLVLALVVGAGGLVIVRRYRLMPKSLA
jgi:hypothetical protein